MEDDDFYKPRSRSETSRLAMSGGGGEVMAAIECIPCFSGDDSTRSSATWAQDVEDYAEIHGWTPSQKLIVARRTLTATAALWLRSERPFKSFDELKAALQKEFPDAVNSKEMHEIMSARKKRKDETYFQYLLVMKELGRRADFPVNVTTEYIIDGIEDYEVNKAILYGATTFPALKEKLLLYEKIKSKTRTKTTERRDTKKQTEDLAEKKRCYSCGGFDHVAGACPNGVKCFRCNNYGHIASDCTAEKPSIPVTTTSRMTTATTDASVEQSRSGAVEGASGSEKVQSVKQQQQSSLIKEIIVRSSMFTMIETTATNHNVAHDSSDSAATDVSPEDAEVENVQNKDEKSHEKPIKVEQYAQNQVKEAPIELKIILKDDVPFARKPRRLYLVEPKIVIEQLKPCFEDGKVQESFSETSSSNKKRKTRFKYAVGDIVATKRIQYGRGPKLKAKYLGPYKVVKVKMK